MRRFSFASLLAIHSVVAYALLLAVPGLALGQTVNRASSENAFGSDTRLALGKRILKVEHPLQREKVRIVLVGDSTVAEGGGWGPAFSRLLGPEAQCINMARSGRSSRSFLNEGHWKKALEQKPDYVLIQFGHNDMPGKGPERETDPRTTFQEFLTRYIDEARTAGAKPILVTSMTRRLFGKDGKIASNLIPYAEATKAVAEQKKVPLVDLHARSIALLDQMGPNAAAVLNPQTKDPKKPDLTHLSARGGELIAPLVADELQKVEPRLAYYLDRKPPLPDEKGSGIK